MRSIAVHCCLLLLAAPTFADSPRVFPPGELPADVRLGELRNLNSYFPFKHVDDAQQWQQRQADIQRRILVSQGLWPMPSKAPLNAVIHGRVERDDYVVDRVFFESIPGHYVTGSLYRPKDKSGPLPAILSPHGHWRNGRFYDAGEAQIKHDLASGAEQFPIGGRYPIQARAVQLARMGCLVFVYDMTGNADSIQIGHRPDKSAHLDTAQDWGFFSVQAELRLQNMMGLQTWNSIRAIDFLLELDDIDPRRIGVTGASGGGTQSMIIGAIDERIAAAMPCVMVSTAMQGGCTCENAPYMRIDQGNIDIAAAIAPRPLGLTAADDWTVELATKGYPDLRDLYAMLGQKNRLTAVFHTQFKHNYNQVNRSAMYGFFNQHFELGFDGPIAERDFTPLTQAEATVWSDKYPAPSGDAVGDAHEIRINRLAAKDSQQRIEALVPSSEQELEEFRRVVGGGWQTILRRSLDQVGDVKFTETKHLDHGGFVLTLGHLDHAGEQLPMAKLSIVDGIQKGVVVWVGENGKSSLLEGDRVIPAAESLLKLGYTIVSADLFQQGEFLQDDQPRQAQRMWYQRQGEAGWERFSGYTYGFNDSVFVQRVHDVLTLIKYAQSLTKSPVILVGLGRGAGTIASAARVQTEDAVAKAFLDCQGFRFQNLTRHDDPMFVTGAVKYLDVDGLLALGRGPVHVVGPQQEIALRVARAAGHGHSIQWHDTRADLIKAMQQSLR